MLVNVYRKKKIIFKNRFQIGLKNIDDDGKYH